MKKIKKKMFSTVPTTKPKVTMAELKEKDPEAYGVFQFILLEFIKLYDLSKLNLGLEKTLETVEGLVDKGYVRVCHDPDEDSFFIKAWNGKDYE